MTFVRCPATGHDETYHQTWYPGMVCSHYQQGFVDIGSDSVTVEEYLGVLDRRLDRLAAEFENQAMGDDL
jgi:hypothetical protein